MGRIDQLIGALTPKQDSRVYVNIFQQPPSRRPPSRHPDASFRERIAKASTAGAPIALTHITDTHTLDNCIVKSKTLDTVDSCAYFGERIIYTFYLRPAYRIGTANMHSNMECYEPVCFLMRPAVTSSLASIFALDTGAVETGRVSAHLHHDMISEDFQLRQNLGDVTKLIYLFYETQANYFRNRVRENIPLPHRSDFTLKSYLSLIREKSRSALDERASAIEVQLRPPVTLTGNTFAIIVSDKLADDPIIQNFSKSIGSELLRYTYIERAFPCEMVGLIYHISRLFYETHSETKAAFSCGV